VLILLEGQVKLSINSSEGKRLILGIAEAGEILGVTSVVSGLPYELTAETLHPCKIASVRRQDFLNFLNRHPEAYHGVADQLSLHYSRACERLRTVGLASSAPAKLARLLLEWCAAGQRTERGTRLKISLTHEEIGEFIGASRETVTRTLSDFKHQQLVALSGSTMMIPNPGALEMYAGV
jgi:CRP/FNR family transcriptional regulator